VDATRVSQALTGSGYVQTIITTEVQTFVQHDQPSPLPPVQLVVRMRFNPTLTKTWFGAVNKVIDNITLLSIVLTGAALIRERERGTIEHLLVMPVTPFEIMASKVWSMGLVVLCAGMLSLVLVVQGVLAVPLAVRAAGPVRRGQGGRDLIGVLRDTGLTMLVWSIAVASALAFGR
jgi:ABC-2 type transport system permease protein